MSAAPVALVSGSASAAGAAVVRALEGEGWRVLACAPDARDEAAFAAALAEAGDRLDAVLLAGEATPAAGFDATSPAAFRAAWEAEVERIVLGTRAGMRALAARGAGGAILGLVAGPAAGPAGAAVAGALDHFCRIAAVEAGGFAVPVRVNMVRAGTGGPAAPGALAGAAAFLAGAGSRMVTGVTLVVGEAA